MADFDWTRIAAEAGIAAFSAVGGAVLTAWKWGRGSAKEEQSIKDDYDAKITGLREEVRKDMASLEKTTIQSRDMLVDQFKESFEGIRRQFDEHKFYTEKDFVRKDDFKEFREEHREDLRDIKKSLDGVKGMLTRPT
jgi:hypothetical protein